MALKGLFHSVGIRRPFIKMAQPSACNAAARPAALPAAVTVSLPAPGALRSQPRRTSHLQYLVHASEGSAPVSQLLAANLIRSQFDQELDICAIWGGCISSKL